MTEAYIYDAVRTPRARARQGGALHSVTPIELAATSLRALRDRTNLDTSLVDDVVLGCVEPVGEQGANIARVAALYADYALTAAGVTVSRFCASGLEACNLAAAQIMAGQTDLMVAGGVESMSRAPFVMPKSDSAFGRDMQVYDTTIGWRFANPAMKKLYDTHSMPQTADNVAEEFNISRADQDAFAIRSQQRWGAAHAAGCFADELVPVVIAQKKGDPKRVDTDEHPRPETTLADLTKLKGVNGPELTVTAGNASGVNDGACALLIASAAAAEQYSLKPLARVVGMATAGVAPRIMGFGPSPAVKKVLAQTGLSLNDMDVIELNEAFAAQALAVLRDLGLADDAAHVNPNGGAIALGHPLGMSGARLVTTAAYELKRRGGRYALCTMCIGVGQGIAMVIERV